MNLIIVLLMFVVIGAVIAIWTRDLLSAVIAVSVVGFTRTVVFVLLRAPDVAITQVVVEVLMLIILIRSAVRRGIHTVEGARSVPGTAVAAAFIAVMLVFGVIALRESAPFGVPVLGPAGAEARVKDAPSLTYLKDGKNDTGNSNAVTAILVDYRGYDTLGEVAVLFTATIGAIALLRRKSRRTPAEAGAANLSNGGSECPPDKLAQENT